MLVFNFYQWSANLRLVQVIVFEQPDVCGLETQLLFSSIKAREDQKGSSAMFHYVQSFLNIYNMEGLQSLWNFLLTFKIKVNYMCCVHLGEKDLFPTSLDSNLRGKKFLEGGEDATVWNNHRCKNLHFLLTFPHFHTCYMAHKGSLQSVTCRVHFFSNRWKMEVEYHKLLPSH